MMRQVYRDLSLVLQTSKLFIENHEGESKFLCTELCDTL